MMLILPALLCLIMFACLALLYKDGMWSNAIRLINVVTAAMLATNYFEPLAKWLDSLMPAFTYFWDFISLWVLFVVFMMIFQVLTGAASKVNVRFLGIADRLGSLVFAAWIGWILMCFTLMTLHTAPLSRNFLFGNFRSGEEMLFGMAPDHYWLGLEHRVSKGSFSRSLGEEEQGRYGKGEKAVFDLDRRFIAKYAERRSGLEKNIASGKGICPDPGSTPSR
jgi:uncharacterized membrane protein required for colicin V production